MDNISTVELWLFVFKMVGIITIMVILWRCIKEQKEIDESVKTWKRLSEQHAYAMEKHFENQLMFERLDQMRKKKLGDGNAVH